MSTRTIAVILTADSSSLRAALMAAARDVDTFDKSIGRAGVSSAESGALMTSAAKGGATALAVALAYSVKSAADFEAAMRNVNSISGLSEAAFKAQGAAVLDLSRQLPQSAKTLAQGLYDIASSGFQGADGLTVLKQSAIAASAGLTTTQNAAKAITAVLNAYGLSASQAGHVSDVLFQTVNLGVVNFEELTGVIGDSVGVAAAASVSIDEVGAAVATMTLSGVSAAEAGTSLNRVLTDLIKPNDNLRAVLKAQGYESGIAAVKALGLKGTMDLLRTATGGTADAVVALFSDTRAARGAFALMANDGQRYAEVTAGIGKASDGAGASQKALNEQMKSLSMQWKVFVNDINAAAIAGGEKLLPFLSDVLRGSRELASDALPGLQSGLAALSPFFHNVAEVGGDLVDIAKQLYEDLSPLGKALSGIAAGGAIESLNALSAVLSALTGFLADHETAVTAVALAYAGFFLVAKGAAALAALPVLLETISVGLYSAAGAADTAAASLLTLQGAALALAVVAGALAFAGAIKGMQDAKAHADALYAAVVKPFDLSSYKGLSDALSELDQKQADLEANTKTRGGLANAFRGAIELLTPMKNSVQEARDLLKKYNEEAEALATTRANIFENTSSVANATGQSREAVEELAKTLKVDLTQSFDESGPARKAIIDNLQQMETAGFGAGRGLAAVGQLSVDEIKAAADAVDELAKKTGDAFSKSFDLVGGYGQAQADNAKALEQVASATDRVTSAQDRLGSAQQSAQDAQQRVLDAQDKVTEAEDRVSTMRADNAQKAADEQAAYADRVIESQDKVTAAEEHVSELRADFAQKAADDQQAYADKVAESDARILDTEQNLADKRISLAQSVADAQQKLEDDRLSGEERVQAAQQRLQDVQDRNAKQARDLQQRAADQRALDAAKDPEARKRVQAQIDARKAREDEADQRTQAAKDLKAAQADVDKARKDAADTQRKDEEALAKARLDQTKGIEDAEQQVTKARKEGVDVQREGEKLARDQVDREKQLADAEQEVVKARKDAADVQRDGEKLARDQIDREKQLADAVKSVDSARRDVTKAQQDDARAADAVGKAQGDVSKAYGELADAQQRVADTSLEGFFARTLADAKTFADGITDAARQGLNPALIAQLLEDGPSKAAPILQAIMADHNGTLVSMLNETTDKLREAQLSAVEMARVTQRAINTTSADMAADYGTAMDILATKAALGGQATSNAIAEKLGIGVDKVRQIAHDYVIVLADGLNPLLTGVGAPTIDVGGQTVLASGATGDTDRGFHAAMGGQVPGVGDTDSVPAMLMPGEFVARKSVVQEQGADAFAALNAGHADIVRRFAVGGFVSPDDVPKPPDASLYGSMVGYTGDIIDKKAYDAVVAFVRDHPPAKGGGGGGGSSGGGYGYQALIDYLSAKGVPFEVTSTTGGGHAEGSRHYMGLAADFVSDDMAQIARAFMEIQSSMYELIHNPGFSVKAGEQVDPSFWGDETWAGHTNHVHAATFKDAAEGPGIPGTGGGSSESSGGGGSGDDARAIGRAMAADRGWTGSEWTALDKLWTQESSWDPNAVNPESGAYGIPQSLGHGHPYDLGDTRAQVAWGLDYISDRYGDPAAAWQHEQDYGWYRDGGLVKELALRSYDQSGWMPPGLSLAYNGTGRPEAVGADAIDYDRLAGAMAKTLVESLRHLPQPVLKADKRVLAELVAEGRQANSRARARY